jgi:hypothetical protein
MEAFRQGKAAGRDGDGFKESREILEFNPGHGAVLGYQSYQHLVQGELDQALALMEKSYAVAPMVPNQIGALAGLLMRTGNTRRAEELLQKLRPGDAFGAPRGLATYHWVLREFDADWIEKATDQHDPGILTMLRVWWERGSAPHSTLGRANAQAQSPGNLARSPATPAATRKKSDFPAPAPPPPATPQLLPDRFAIDREQPHHPWIYAGLGLRRGVSGERDDDLPLNRRQI